MNTDKPMSGEVEIVWTVEKRIIVDRTDALNTVKNIMEGYIDEPVSLGYRHSSGKLTGNGIEIRFGGE